MAFTNYFNYYSLHTTFYSYTYIHIQFYICIFIFVLLLNKTPVQTQSTSAKAPAILDPENVPAAALSTNEKATLNLLGWVGFDRPLEGCSVNH